MVRNPKSPGWLILLLTGGVAGWFWARWDTRTTPPDSAGAVELQQREADDNELLQWHMEVVDRSLRDSRRTNLTRDRAQLLKLSLRFLQGYVERYSGNRRPERRPVSAAAYRQRSLANLLLRDFVESEVDVRASLRICRTQLNVENRPDFGILRCSNESTLGWLLAMTGRLGEAEQMTQAAVSGWKALAENDPNQTSYFTELAISLRNLAMIREARGLDGLKQALASVEAAMVAKSRRELALIRYETLIDSERFLGMLLASRGQYEKAKQHLQSSMTHLRTLLMEYEFLFESESTMPPLDRYRTALERAEKNFDEFNRRNNPDSSVSGLRLHSVDSPDDWNWRFLSSLPGQILAMDLLARGNRLPGEFEPQDALLLNWNEEWCHEELLQIVAAVHQTLPVVLIVGTPLQQREAERTFRSAGIALDRIEYMQVPTDTVWTRDYGPFCVRSISGVPAWVDSTYEYPLGWGRYDDDEVPQILGEALNVPVITTPLLMEGGALLSNGAGLCLVSQQLLDRNQTMGMSASQLTATIKRLFGAEQVVYLEPMKGEPNGHVDWFCTFTAPATVVVGECGAEDPVNRGLLNRHAETLKRIKTSVGKLNVVRIPMPPPAADYSGGSYTNVIFANGVLVVPSWPEASREMEQHALEVYQQLLPGWRIVPVSSGRLGRDLGGPRCCSMNLLLRHSPQVGFGDNGRGT